MSDQRIDRLIKQQLESVSPAYQPHAWNRFQKRLPVRGGWPWVGRYGGWLLSGLMLAGWLSTLYLIQQHQLVLTQLQKTLRMATPPANPPHPPDRASHRIDTIYIVKRTIIEHRYLAAPPGSLVADNHWSYGRKLAKPPGLVAPPVVPARPLTADSGRVTATRFGEPPISTLSSAQPASPKAPAAQPARPDSLAQKPVSDQPQSVPTLTKPPRTPFRFAVLKPRLGIETLLTPCLVGVGPAVELALSDNLGISIGVQAAQVRSATHRSLKDYNRATGNDFEAQYRSYLPAQYDRIDDISVHTSVISLPISLKYYVPLTRRWSLLLQTGTSLDLAAYQQVHYDSDIQGDEQYNTFDTDAGHRVFHNFVFGAGVRFHTARFSGQLVPTYRYDFRGMANLPAGSDLGLRGSVWIDLAK